MDLLSARYMRLQGLLQDPCVVEEAACLSHASHTLTGSSAHTKNRLNTRLTYLQIYPADAGSSQQKFWGRIQQPKPSTTSPNILLLSQQTLAA